MKKKYNIWLRKKDRTTFRIPSRASARMNMQEKTLIWATGVDNVKYETFNVLFFLMSLRLLNEKKGGYFENDKFFWIAFFEVLCVGQQQIAFWKSIFYLSLDNLNINIKRTSLISFHCKSGSGWLSGIKFFHSEQTGEGSKLVKPKIAPILWPISRFDSCPLFRTYNHLWTSIGILERVIFVGVQSSKLLRYPDS